MKTRAEALEVRLDHGLRVLVTRNSAGDVRYRVQHRRIDKGVEVWRGGWVLTPEQLDVLGRNYSRILALDLIVPALGYDWRSEDHRQLDQDHRVGLLVARQQEERKNFAAELEIHQEQADLDAVRRHLLRSEAIDAFGTFVRRLAKWDLWGTFTFSNPQPGEQRAWALFNRLRQDLKKDLCLDAPVPTIVALETSGQGGLHFHALFGLCDQPYAMQKTELVWRKHTAGNPKVEVYNAEKGAAFYLLKYGKDGDYNIDVFDVQER